jgi:hypothetical protein
LAAFRLPIARTDFGSLSFALFGRTALAVGQSVFRQRRWSKSNSCPEDSGRADNPKGGWLRTPSLDQKTISDDPLNIVGRLNYEQLFRGMLVQGVDVGEETETARRKPVGEKNTTPCNFRCPRYNANSGDRAPTN